MHCQMKRYSREISRRRQPASSGLILGLLACIAIMAVMTGCPPPKPENVAKKGVFIALTNRIFDRGDEFDIKDRIEYPEIKTEGMANADIDVTDRQLAMYRCTWCHECGFNQAFDVKNYGKPGWNPYYRGEQWQPIVARMRPLENSMLNEVLAERIYNFLRDSTLGKYDESKDRRGGTIRDFPISRGGTTPPPGSTPPSTAPVPRGG